MSTYVVSDLHGCLSDLKKLLKQINFTEEDRLIIAGDIVDRGPENYETLNWVLNEKPDNIEIIMGNHDVSFIDNINLLEKCNVMEPKLKNAYQVARRCWYAFDYYGSIDELIRKKKCKLEDLKVWAQMMEKFPYMKELNINGRDFIIIHAGYIDDSKKDMLPELGYTRIEDFYTCAREEGLNVGGKEHTTIVTGHTPTIAEGTAFYNKGQVFRYEKEDMDCVIYDIDCGNVFYGKHREDANMACLRLEDEQIIYLDRKK